MNKLELESHIKELNFDVNVDKLEHLLESTLKTNELFNLTAIKDVEKFRELMILDSLYPLRLLDFANKTVLDVGTGAGFPGLVLALASNANLFLLDSTKKKIDYIKSYAEENDIKNVQVINARIEDYASKNRDKFDIAIARAVAPLNVLVETIVPAIKINGYFVAMKGKQGLEEIKEAKRALKELGCVVEKIDEFELPESKEKRFNILIKKTQPTKKRYPRKYNEIIDKPL